VILSSVSVSQHGHHQVFSGSVAAGCGVESQKRRCSSAIGTIIVLVVYIEFVKIYVRGDPLLIKTFPAKGIIYQFLGHR
jgi:hypothetical protein